MSYQSQYESKRMSAQEAIKHVKNGDFIVVPTGAGEPPVLLTALSDARRSYKDVKVGSVLPMRKFGYLDPETYENVRMVSFFLGGQARPGAQLGWVEYIPCNFSDIPRKMERGNMAADVVFALFVGIALAIKGEAYPQLHKLFNEGFVLCMQLVG